MLVHLAAVNRILYLELEGLVTAVSLAPCYLGDSGLELSAPPFSYL